MTDTEPSSGIKIKLRYSPDPPIIDCRRNLTLIPLRTARGSLPQFKAALSGSLAPEVAVLQRILRLALL
jgi:hypothetical protein